jgi:hypothetical protein
MPSFPQHRNQGSTSSTHTRPLLATRLSSTSNESNSTTNDSRKRQTIPPLRVGGTSVKRIRKP